MGRKIMSGGSLCGWRISRQILREPCDAFLELGPLDGVGETHMFIGTVGAEIDPGREGDRCPLEDMAREHLAVDAEPGAVGVYEKAAGRSYRYAEAQPAQRRHEQI